MADDELSVTELEVPKAQLSPRPRVAVLGAGLQGCCVALAAAQLGLEVEIFDEHPSPLSGASLHNEGKIHLGFVYGSDPIGQTAELMLDGALSFARVVEMLAGLPAASYLTPARFAYGLPTDSQIGVEAFEQHSSSVMHSLTNRLRSPGFDYLGSSNPAELRRLNGAEFLSAFDPQSVAAAWSSPELAIDTTRLAIGIRRAVSETPGTLFRSGCEVLGVSGTAESTVVEFAYNGTTHRARFDAVVNCLWEGRLAIDATYGLPEPSSVLHRYKAYIRFQAATLESSVLPSTTFVQGPYGDLVNYGDGSYYVSWYPTFRLGTSDALDGRHLHELLCTADRNALLANGLGHMARFLPALRHLEPESGSLMLGGGVIVARADSDIDDSRSGLHGRASIGPSQHGPYITVETGKLTTAPRFAEQVQQMLAALFGLPEVGRY